MIKNIIKKALREIQDEDIRENVKKTDRLTPVGDKHLYELIRSNEEKIGAILQHLGLYIEPVFKKFEVKPIHGEAGLRAGGGGAYSNGTTVGQVTK